MVTEFKTGFGTGEAGEAAGRAAATDALSRIDAASVDFVVVYSSPSYDSEQVIEGVRSVTRDAQLVGATANGKFTERGVHTSNLRDTRGVTVTVLASDEMRFFTRVGRNLTEDIRASVDEATADLPEVVEGYPHRTGLLLSSSVFGRDELAHLTYQAVPIEWAGGGANDPTLENVEVFHGDEALPDAVVLTVIASKQPLSLGVGNRHSPIGGSFEITKSDGMVVHELDGDPAYEVWKRAFEETAQERYGFGMDEIERDRVSLVQAFTELVFGIKTGEGKYKVRSPFATAFCEPYLELGQEGGLGLGEDHPLADFPTFGTLPEGALQFPFPMAEGTVLYPMTSGKEGTIQRGTRSVQQAMADISDEGIAGGLVFECPCGEATLQDEYNKLIEAVADQVDAPISGIQSGGGEVCFRSDDMRGVHETSTTVLLFPKGAPA